MKSILKYSLLLLVPATLLLSGCHKEPETGGRRHLESRKLE